MSYLLYILLFVTCSYGFSNVDPIIDTKQGLIRGLPSDNGQYLMFLGIPYAKVDETNPFGPSVPYGAFNGTFEAFDDSAVCPQILVDTHTAIGTIDCLRLNVYVPQQTSSLNRLPVMVWIHSGALLQLSGNRVKFTPDFLVRHNVIIVSINYRLGVYGFLCLDTPTVSGNQGLKDQYLALKWVKENIESFGGDANKVTIFGESAGAHSIHLHLLSNFEKLYDRVIVQSGVAVTPMRLVKPDNTAPLRIAAMLDFKTDNVEDTIKFLAKQHAHLITKVSKELKISSFNGTAFPQTRPCIENKFEGAFITDYPFNIKPTNVRNMPIMFGHTNQEMLYKIDKVGPEVLDKYSFKDRLTSGLDLIDDEIVDLIKHFYVGDAKVDVSLKNEILNFESDFNFNHPTRRTIKRYMNEGARPIYYYIFCYEGGRNNMKIMRNVNGTGAAHGDDLGYIFISDLVHDTPTPADQRVIDTITTMWTNFAKYGDPTPEITDLLPIKWVPVNETAQNYLKIDSKITLLSRPFQARMAFWDLFYKLNGESQNGTENKHNG